MTHLPKFSPALLHPRYWLLWLGIGLLWLVVQLPYPLIYRLGNAIGRLAMRFMKRRAKIAYRNLELCFPEKSEQERHRMVVMNFESVGMGLMETGMAWFWPVRRIARWTDTIGFEHIRDVQAQQRGILLIGIHFLTLEMGARMFGMNEPGIGVYRPNDNPVIDWLQTWGRLRSNKDMIDRKDLKGMIRALKKRRSGVVRTGSRLRPDRQRLRPTVCGRPGGDHLRHLDAGENVQSLHRALRPAPQTGR